MVNLNLGEMMDQKQLFYCYLDDHALDNSGKSRRKLFRKNQLLTIRVV